MKISGFSSLTQHLFEKNEVAIVWADEDEMDCLRI